MGLRNSVSAANTTRFVDCTNGSDAHGGTNFSTDAYQHLAYANSAASNGDTIRVVSGTCTETGTLSLSKGITWIADDGIGNAGAVTIKVASANPVADVTNGVGTTQNFTGFTFDGQNRAYTIYLNSAGTKNFVNSTIKDASTNVIYANSGGIANFTGGAISSASGIPEMIRSYNDTFVFTNVTLTNNTSSSHGGKILLSSAASPNTVTFDGCTILNTDTSASADYASISMRGTANLSLNNSTIHKETSTGQLIYDAASSGVSITNNTNLYYRATGAGLYLASIVIPISGTGTSTITNNTFDVTGVSVLIDSKNNSENNFVFTGNNVTFSNALSSSAILNRSNTLYSTVGATGSNNISNNTFTVNGTGTGGLIVSLTRSVRVSADAFTFDHNIITIASTASYQVMYIKETDVGTVATPVSIQYNTLTQNNTSAASSLFFLLDVPHINFSHNTITNHATNQHIFVATPSDVVSWTGVGHVDVANNNIAFDSTNGVAIEIGEDATSGPTYDQKYNGSIVEHNTLTGPASSGSGAYTGNYHTILIGHQKGVYVRYNKANGGAIGLVIKATTIDNEHTGGIYGNIFENNYTEGILVKGCKNEDIFNNTFYNTGVSNTLAGTSYPAISMSYDGDPNYENGGGTAIYNNMFYWQSGLRAVNADQYSYTGVTLNKNIYYNDIGSSAAQLFDWDTVVITGFSNWVAASGETNSSFSNPQLVSSIDYNLQSISPAIDSGTSVGLTTDYLGNPIYGTPDIGAYEYQPPHNLITSDTIDIGAGARIYADGKFRDLGTTNSAPAHLKITPSGGSFTSYDAVTTRPAYLDVTGITNWTNTHKTWIEGNAQTSNMITDHTIGDLDNNKYYTITVSGAFASNITGINGTTCTNAVCQSSGSGTLSFEYNGGYSTHTFDMIEDATAPTGSFTINSSATTTTSATVTLVISATDNVDSAGSLQMQIANDASFTGISYETYATSKSWSLASGDGVKTVYVRFKDTNGNVSATYSHTITLDTTAPAAFTPTFFPASWTNATSSTVTFATTDASSDIASYSVKVDSGSYDLSVTSPYTFNTSTLADGTHTVTIKAQDNAGNYIEEAGTVFIDRMLPTVSSSIAPASADGSNGYYKAVPTITLSANDASSGVASISYHWDSDADMTYANSLTALEGNHILYFHATDNAGNASVTGSREVTVDTNAPVISGLGVSTSENSATISWKTNELASSQMKYGYKYSLNTSETDTNPRVTTHIITISNLKRCTTYHYRVSSTDTTGNQSTSDDKSLKTTGCSGSASSSETPSTYSPSASPSESPTSPNATPTPDSSTSTTTAPHQIEKIPVFKIQILDPNGKALAHVKLVLHSEPIEATTDGSGTATFENVEKGKHTLDIAYNNQTVSREIDLSQSTAIDNTVRMEITLSSPNTTSYKVIIGLLGLLLLIGGLLSYRKIRSLKRASA